ncbi:hypothetical protein A2572_04740 [Candidatus Collierbacteria bacterium RIFOXYD1_FULL_40_9]|uniref:Uncharacterized protein n=1 Tax=Candidatus Collierbacteria bacterium RIFOXYD1_FULL_40_9 TaxID=1817731 RepID=A0A1F5FVD5_9BACT|nr:MAG: hypothetical protein A2572_04740 [Candidatus Collierbacteria bacterium RIFOXYD1_FULL_40_9]
MNLFSAKVRSFLLSLIWVVTLIHFFKDITQDILRIPTILDVFGNIQEDVSWLPTWTQYLVYGAGISSFLAEVFLLISIPIVKNREEKSSLEKWVAGVVFFMLIYFPIVILLDPRFKIVF